MADIQSVSGNHVEAAHLFEQCYRAIPSAANLYKWAGDLALAGQAQAAAEKFAAFEKQARSEVSQPYNANLQLIAFYNDRKTDPAEAFRIATLESSRYADTHTLAALAWALYQNGKFVEAKTAMDNALAVGTRDPVYLSHASRISAKVGGTE